MTLKELKELLAGLNEENLTQVIDKLKHKRELPDISMYRKQYDVDKHETLDKAKRPDKQIVNNDGQPDYAKVNRLAFPMQKLIVKRALSFLFGSPVKLVCDVDDQKQSSEKKVFDAVDQILFDNKSNSFNRKIARECFRSTEVAECWFPVEKEEQHEDYGGIKTKFRLRVMAFNPWDDNELYPLFDETGDMIAFSRAFTRTNDDGKKIEYFETYTEENTILISKNEATWMIDKKPNVIKKIPVIYAKQDEVEWNDVQWSVDRLEYLLSNFADTNDYHAAPKIFIQGKIVGFAKKGESGTILEGEKDSTAEYLSWNHAPEAVKLEIETLLRFIYSFTQTPDISFEAVKGLNEISGEALKMLFLDAHLKVLEKREIFDEYLQRRVNLIKAFVGTLDNGLKSVGSKLRIIPEIQPFIINSQKELIEMLTSAVQAGIMSRKQAVIMLDMAENVDEELAQIEKEEKERNTMSIGEPTI
jgi:SPP1 family phage portal protein